MSENATAIILAAGEGTRMRSSLPKVIHEILGVPLVSYVIDAAHEAGLGRVVVITGHGAERVEAALDGQDVEFARQDQQLGTGHAVMCALEVTGTLAGPVVVLSGDVPLVRAETIAQLVDKQQSCNAACAMLTAMFDDPTGYGRVIRSDGGAVKAIIEQKDLPANLLGVKECNAGVYCFDGAALSANLSRLETANAQGEYYLTDLVGMFVDEGLDVEVVVASDAAESNGINTRVQLAEVTRVMQGRINERHMLAGVTMLAPETVWIGPAVRIGRDAVLEPVTSLNGSTVVGDEARIGPNTRITDSDIGPGARVDSSIISGARVGAGAVVGPGAHLHPGTVVKSGTTVSGPLD
ncbi:MAG: bifunctional UDP-N-acetylglucosamine diphosphorylase/glucosamine-1-phosphate N-acetyltransferase GlmU [Coriobacteriia bacterium]